MARNEQGRSLNRSKVMDSASPNNISAIILKSLDEIIRFNRNLFELRLATKTEIQSRQKEIRCLQQVKDVIEDWRLICLCEKQVNKSQMLLLGRSANKHRSWITSPVISIDFKQMVVLTRSWSIYKLGGEQGQGEPPIEHLAYVCVALHAWGIGSFLGVPEFFVGLNPL